MATPIITTGTPTAWSPDTITLPAKETLGDALIMRAATVVTTGLEGDAPVARLPWVDDDEADFVAEGSEIDEADPTLSEVVVPTAKVAQLLRISREQWHQAHTAHLLDASVVRAVTKKANSAFLAQPAPTAPDYTPPEGITSQGMKLEEKITNNLDPLADALGIIEANGGEAGVILADPYAWAKLRTLKTATGSNAALLGAGTDDQEKRLFGIPVITTAAVTGGDLVVVDPTAIAAGVGPLQVAVSEHVYFARDSVALRCTWRIGWGVQHPERVVTVKVEGITGTGSD